MDGEDRLFGPLCFHPTSVDIISNAKCCVEIAAKALQHTGLIEGAVVLVANTNESHILKE